MASCSVVYFLEDSKFDIFHPLPHIVYTIISTMSDEKYHARIRADFKRMFAEARAKRAIAKK